MNSCYNITPKKKEKGDNVHFHQMNVKKIYISKLPKVVIEYKIQH